MLRKMLVVLVAVVVVALMVAGCGQKKESSADAKAILEDSSNKMQEVATVKADGSYEMSTQAEGAEEMELSFQMEMDMSDPNNPKGRMVMKGMGEDVDVYMDGGYAYAEVAGSGWVKTPLETGSLSQPTPTEITQFAENAKDLKITSEDSNSYTLDFEIDRAYIEEQMAASEGFTVEGSEEYGEMIEAIVNSMTMNATFKVAKDTKYIEDATIKMEISDMPMAGNMAVNMKMSFSDYNQPVDVVLPAAAASAREVESLPSSAGGIPGFPGMNF